MEKSSHDKTGSKLIRREITLINRTESPPKHWFEKWEKILALIATPITVAIVGFIIQFHVSRDATKQEYVRIAVAILREKPEETNKPLRGWAVRLLDQHSAVKLKEDERAALESGAAMLPYLADEEGRILRADSEIVNADSTNATADGAIKKPPGAAQKPKK